MASQTAPMLAPALCARASSWKQRRRSTTQGDPHQRIRCRPTLGAQMLAQQLTAAGIKQTHEHSVPLHIHLPPDPARWRSIVGRINLDTAIDAHRALAVLQVVAERLDWQHLQKGLLFGEHRRHLPLGAAVDALIGPVLFPVIQVRLRFFKAFRTSCPSAASFAHGLRPIPLFLFDPDRALCTAVPSRRSGPRHRGTADSGPDHRKSGDSTPSRRRCSKTSQPRRSAKPAGRPSRATRPTHALSIGRPADEHTCDSSFQCHLQTAASGSILATIRIANHRSRAVINLGLLHREISSR